MNFRSRGFAMAFLVAILVAAVAPGSASASKPGYGCGAGFNLGALSYQQYLLLPGTQAALDQGLASEEGILGGLTHFDHNGNGVVCVQSVPGWLISNKPFATYLYNVVDDNSSAP